MMSTKCFYLALAAFLAADAAPEAVLEGCAAGAGACEEADIERAEEGEAELLRVELLQQKLATKTVEDLSHDRDEQIEFSLGKEEFARAGELIPKKLKAAGLPMAEFVPRFLAIASASGAELQAQPKDSDFPLRFRYKALRQEAAASLWSRRRRTEERTKPQFETYQSTAEEVDFETLAANVYDEASADPACWKREEFHTFTDETWGGQDHAAVYSCRCDYCQTSPAGNGASLLGTGLNASADVAGDGAARKATSCALTISGSNDLMDWTENLDAIWNGEFCGKDKYHRGFADEANAVVSKPGFASLVTRVKTCDRLVLIGHSLGGAVASLIAECINCQDCKKPPALRGVGIEAELYTFGAPALYDGDAPTNGHAASGTFKGRRFWNYDMRSCVHRWCSSWCCWSLGNQDPVPYVAQKIGYKHPKIEAVGLDEHGEVEVWDADNDQAVKEPDSFQWPSIGEHMNSAYIARIKMHLKH